MSPSFQSHNDQNSLDVAGGRTTAGEVIASMLADYVKLVQLIDNAMRQI